MRQAVLYARAATRYDAESTPAISRQLEALRAYASQEGYEVVEEGYSVLEEVQDPGYSGARLERPGLDRVRDLVATGSVAVVLTQDRDRISREPAYRYLLEQEFSGYGTKLRSLTDRGDESPEGQLTDAILDKLSKFERAKTEERTRRGKLRKAREGKLLAGNNPDYGFVYTAARDGYIIDADTMPVVRRVFSMLAEGASLHGVVNTLNAEGIKPPGGPSGKSGRWNVATIRDSLIRDDVYKPHNRDEIAGLVTEGVLRADVAARLDPTKPYRIWWYNRYQVAPDNRAVPERSRGTPYKRRRSKTVRPRSEWIAVPVPDAGIPRAVVDAARAGIAANKPLSKAGLRFWELSGGIARCGVCGRAMVS